VISSSALSNSIRGDFVRKLLSSRVYDVLMPDQLPSGNMALYVFLEMVALAFVFGAVEAFGNDKPWYICVGYLALGILFFLAAIKWGTRTGFVIVALLATLIIGYGAYRYYNNTSTKAESPPPVSPLSSVSLHLGCEWDHIPIHIPTASTIHVMRLHPANLYGNPLIPDVGVFEDISSTSSKMLDWPSKAEGRWMTLPEMKKVMAEGKPLPSPYAFNCTLTSYGPGTLEDIVAELILDTSDGKRLRYPVAFDPLSSGQSFSFYIVNVCSSGVTLKMVQWSESATVRVLGEKDKRSVVLRFQKRNWPTLLVPIFGPSMWLWNGTQSCKWDRAN
jgi:hypothetical protein